MKYIAEHIQDDIVFSRNVRITLSEGKKKSSLFFIRRTFLTQERKGFAKRVTEDLFF